MTPNQLGKLLVVAGLALAALGAILWSGVGPGWFGRLPGDLHIERGNFGFHFPLVTCVILSLVLSLLLWFFRK